MAQGLVVAHNPLHVVLVSSGKDLSDVSYAVDRNENPETGWQRVLDKRRVRQIAQAVLDQGNSFPNAVLLAADGDEPDSTNEIIDVDVANSRFQIIDGQHRLMAYRESTTDSPVIASIIWLPTDEGRAKLFKDVNWQQKSINKSLYYDLIRFTQDADARPSEHRAADLCHWLNEEPSSPLEGRIDMVGVGGSSFWIRQASLATQLEKLLARREGWFGKRSLRAQQVCLLDFFQSIRDSFPNEYQEREGILWAPVGIRSCLEAMELGLVRGLIDQPTKERWDVFWEDRLDFDWSKETWRGQSSEAGFRRIGTAIVEAANPTADEWIP